MVIDGNIILRAKSITCWVYTCHVRGFVKFKKNKKFRAKLESGRLDQAPTQIFFWGGGEILCFCVFLVLFSCFKMFLKKIIKKGIGGGWV